MIPLHQPVRRLSASSLSLTRGCLSGLFLFWIFDPGAQAAEPNSGMAAHPLAILQRNCLRCHTEEKRKGGLLLTGRKEILIGGDSGAPFEPGQSGGSPFIEMLFPDADPHMPPKGQLSPPEIEALADWIDTGAPWDDALWKQLRLTPLDGPVQLASLPTGYQPVFSVALAPSGDHLISGRGASVEWRRIEVSQDGKTSELSLVATETPGPDSIQALAWSPDGKWVAAGSFRRIVWWDAASREKKGEITDGLKGRISALAFTQDSKTLLAADSVDSASGLLLAIDPAKGSVTRSIEAHRDTIFAIAVSPDGKQMASVSADKSAKTWDWATGALIHQLEGHTGYVLAAAFSPTGDRLATGGDDEFIKVWQLDSGKQVANFGGARTGPITALAWSVDPEKEKQKAEEKDPEKATAINTDRIVSVNESGQPRIYTELKEHEGEQTSTGAREKSIDAASEELTSVALDPVGFRLFAGSTRGGLFGWNKDGKLEFTLKAPEPIAQTTP